MGFLTDVRSGGGQTIEGPVTDVEFTHGFPLVDEDERTDKENIFLALSITPEGADEPVVKPLYLGNGNYLVIEEDGKVLRAGEDNEVIEDGVPKLYAEGDVFRFINSLAEEGFPVDSRFPSPQESKSIDFRGLLGWRLRIVEETDAEATKKFGKRKVKKGKHKGKEFNRTWTKVAKVLGPPTEESGKVVDFSKRGKTIAEPADGEEETEGVNKEIADKFLTYAIKTQGKNGSIPREKLTLAVTRALAAREMDLDENASLRRFITDEDYLIGAAKRGVIDFDATKKKQTVSLPDDDNSE